MSRALLAEGFDVEETRGPYTAKQREYSGIMRCLVNHANAWRIAAKRSQPTIVVEADFVPVRGFGELPVPAPPDKLSESLTYLYACGPQVWDLESEDVARGHAGGMVAVFIPPRVANLLLRFFDEEIAKNEDGEYRPWDSYVGYWLLERGVQSYMPRRHYGEHGGVPNPEHARAGLGRPHRADVLQEDLAFLPNYALGSRHIYRMTRIRERCWGLARLFSGRYVSVADFERADRLQMLRFALGRYFPTSR